MEAQELKRRALDMVNGLLSSGLDAEEVGCILVFALGHLIMHPDTPIAVAEVLGTRLGK